MTGRYCGVCWAEITGDGDDCRYCEDARVLKERDEAIRERDEARRDAVIIWGCSLDWIDLPEDTRLRLIAWQKEYRQAEANPPSEE